MSDYEHNGWTYDGDRDIRHGGHYFKRRGDGTEVDVVRVTPLSDEGGPDNMFRITSGEVDLDSCDLEAARRAAGLEGEPNEAADVWALLHYAGMSYVDADYTVRIGAKDKLWDGRGEQPEPDYVLNGMTKLRNWIAREYLHPEQNAAPSP